MAPLSPATVYKHLVVVGKALEEAVDAGLIARNPMEAVSKPSSKSKVDQRALEEEEIVQLLEAARGIRFYVPIQFTLATGLRLSEFLSVFWDDLDLDRLILRCRGRKSVISRRTIELSTTTTSLLQSHRRLQLETRLKVGAMWSDHHLVFPCSVGTPWLRRPFYRDYKKVVRSSGLQDPDTVRWHTLRHTAASQWIRHGVDVFTVSRRLGHASAAFTMDVYGHLLKGQQEVAARALDGVFARVAVE